MTGLTKTKRNAYKKRLEERRERLRETSKQSGDARKPVELDQAMVGRLSRMDAIQGQQMALETERRREQDLARIEAAFARMDEDEFGYCASCGEDIAAKRLEFDPAVPTCINCAKGGA